MGLLARLASAFKKPATPTRPFFEPSYRDRFLLNIGTAYDKTAVSGFISNAHNGDTRQFSVFKQEMRAGDSHLDGEVRKLEALLTQAPLEMVPYPPTTQRWSAAKSSEAAKAQDIAAFCRDSLLDPDVDIGRAIRHLLWCILDGAGGLQVIVRPGGGIGGKESLEALDPIPCERFRYLPASTTLVVQPGDDQSVSALVPVGDLGASLVTLVADDHIPSPARRGILRRIVTPWVTKRYGFEWWGRDVELFGSPFRFAHYQPGDEVGKADIEDALQKMGSSGYAAFPAGVDVEFIASVARAASATNPHEAIITFCDKAMSKALLGSTQTSDIEQNAGSKASAGVHFDVVEKFAESYARQICAVLRAQLIKPLVARNYGEDAARMFTPVPMLRIADYDDLGELATALKTLGEAGFDEEVPTGWVHERGGIPKPEEGEPTLKRPTPPTPVIGKPGEKPGEKPPAAEKKAEAHVELRADPGEGTIRELDKKAKAMAPGTGDPIVAKYRHLIDETKRDGGDLGHLASRVRLQAAIYNEGRQETADIIAAVLAEATLRGFSETVQS